MPFLEFMGTASQNPIDELKKWVIFLFRDREKIYKSLTELEKNIDDKLTNLESTITQCLNEDVIKAEYEEKLKELEKQHKKELEAEQNKNKDTKRFQIQSTRDLMIFAVTIVLSTAMLIVGALGMNGFKIVTGG